MATRRTRYAACKWCDLDISGPYTGKELSPVLGLKGKGYWIDRGGNYRCNDGKHKHAPYAGSHRNPTVDASKVLKRGQSILANVKRVGNKLVIQPMKRAARRAVKRVRRSANPGQGGWPASWPKTVAAALKQDAARPRPWGSAGFNDVARGVRDKAERLRYRPGEKAEVRRLEKLAAVYEGAARSSKNPRTAKPMAWYMAILYRPNEPTNLKVKVEANTVTKARTAIKRQYPRLKIISIKREAM